MKEMNHDVPVEVAALWALRENKRLRHRVELLTEYAKRLEDYTQRLAENEKKILEDNARLAKQARQLLEGGAGLTVKQRRRVLSMLKMSLNLLAQGWDPEDEEEDEI